MKLAIKAPAPVADQTAFMAAPPKALKSRKSVLGDLRKMFRGEKEPDAPAMPSPKPVETPVTALHIRRYGITQDQQLTFYSKSDLPCFLGSNRYYVPRCMQAANQSDLDPSIRRFTWIFKDEFASKSSATAAKLESFRGAYSIWYKDPASRPALNALPKTLSQIQGDFWMLKQVQDEPKPGETVEWRDIPTDMLKELNDDWWFMGVLLPDIDDVAAAAAAGGSRGRSSEAKASNQ